MTRRVFISTENAADERVVQVIEGLETAGDEVTTSPINGYDPRWKGWYERGCAVAVESCDVFVSVVTAGYDASTWMAIEATTAWRSREKHGKPRLFLLKRDPRPLPAGFRTYEKTASVLPFDLDSALAVLTVGRAQ